MKNDKKVLFIFGCQRSGTTATLNYFKTIKNIRTFEEHGDIIHDDNKTRDGIYTLRLCNYVRLKEIINNQKEDKVVVKPLVESQYAKHILQSIPNSVGIWIYRNPKDAVASMITKWGKRVGDDFIDAVINNLENNWRNEALNNEIKNFIINTQKRCKFLTSQDKAALFWYVRNSLYFSQELHFNPKISKIRYYYLVNRKPYLPNKLLQLGYDIKVKEINTFNKKSIGKGKDVKLHPIINQLCFDLFERFNESWN